MSEKEEEIWWLGTTVDVLDEHWERLPQDADTKHMSFIPQTETLPPGIRVSIDATDQWGDRRKIQKTFRPIPEDLVQWTQNFTDGFFEMYRRAKTWRREILALREKHGHLPFNHPRKKKRG